MEIVVYEPEYLADLTRLYNDLVAHVPHCHPIQPEHLELAYAGLCGWEAFGETLDKEAVLVALNPGVVGFVHVGEQSIKRGDDVTRRGVIRFLAYRRGERTVGQALLEQAEELLQLNELESVVFFPQNARYPFYHFAYAFLSNRLEHIQALLLCNGYEERGGETFMDWPDMDPGLYAREPDIAIDLDIELKPGAGELPDVFLKAFHDGQTLGSCQFVSAGTFSDHPDVQDWLFATWLGVEKPFRGQDLGIYLFGSALRAAQEAGYRHAALSVAKRRHSVLLFFSNYGFRAVDWTRRFVRTLAEESS